jgi:hypothetical protein
MRILGTAVAQPRVFFSGVIAGAALLAAGYLLALMGGQVSATHGGSANIHACVSLFSSHARIMRPGQPPNCTPQEILVEWPSAAISADLTALEARLDALEGQVPGCLSDSGGTALFTGCNVQIVSGAGSTDATPNGQGNLIVGYNENINGYFRTGSHNIVVGEDHGYSSYGGLVVGDANQINAPFASVTGGRLNEAASTSSSVTGGTANVAVGEASSVSGGNANTASGQNATVGGGSTNSASGDRATVSGGGENRAIGNGSSVSGGSSNDATGTNATVSGGFDNFATGNTATVSGGTGLVADDPFEHLP